MILAYPGTKKYISENVTHVELSKFDRCVLSNNLKSLKLSIYFWLHDLWVL